MECIPGVVVPDVVPEGSSSDVLVLSWVEGERLTDSSAADVRQLCNTLLSAYLHQVGCGALKELGRCPESTAQCTG